MNNNGLLEDVAIVARATLKDLIAENKLLTPRNYKVKFHRKAEVIGKESVLRILQNEVKGSDFSLQEVEKQTFEKEKAISEMTEEARKILVEVMEVFESVKDRSDERNRNLDKNLREINEIFKLDDLIEMKTRLVEELEKVKKDNVVLKNKLNNTAKDLGEKAEKLEQFKELANTDPLTKIANRRAWAERMGQELSRIRRLGGSFSIIFIDIDHFKKINDTYGHPVGDEVLIAFSSLMKAHLREIDIVARCGGEEFSIILPETDIQGAKRVAERIKEELKKKVFIDRKKDVSFKVTASFGITECRSDDTLEDIIERGDDALYRAKEGGRDRIEISLK